ncbi:MAG TPA: hypothetical protein VN083_11420, partial [Vicinamibacteria bacterium]|nr:hypothetical protein [Vicinamibacteria bacterium]
MPSLDDQVAELAGRYRPLAAKILQEAIRIPADYVDRAPEEAAIPSAASATTRGRGSNTCGVRWW